MAKILGVAGAAVRVDRTKTPGIAVAVPMAPKTGKAGEGIGGKYAPHFINGKEKWYYAYKSLAYSNTMRW